MNRLLAILALATFSSSVMLRAVDPIIAQIGDSFSIDPRTAALLATAYALPYALIQPFVGALADTLSKTRVMVTSLMLTAAACVMAATAVHFEVVVASRIIAGVVSGGIFPIALAIAGDRSPIAQRQVAIGKLLFAVMMGSMLGGPLAGLIADWFGWRGVFLALGGVCLIAGIAIGVAFRGHEERGKFDLSKAVGNYRAILTNPLAKICFGAVFLEGVFLFGIFAHIAGMMHEIGETRASIAGIVLAGFGIGGIAYTLTVSRILPLVGERRMMISGGAAMACGLLIVALRPPWPVEAANFALLGFGFFLLHGVIQVYVSELAPAARASALSLHSAFYFFGHAAGPAVYGLGFATFGIAPVLVIGAAVLFATGLVCARTLRRHTPT